MNGNNKKVMIISVIIAIVFLIIGVVSYFMAKPKSNNEIKYGINDLFEKLKTEQTYSFSAIYNSENKLFFAKQDDKAYIDNIVDGVETKFLIQNGNTYLIKDEDKTYYTYKNNKSKINKIVDTLEELKDSEYEIGSETIDDKTYSYVEYNQLTDFAIMNTQKTKSSDTKKTRFYFDGNDLVYIKTIAGNIQELLKVSISKNVDKNLFEMPLNYEEK